MTRTVLGRRTEEAMVPFQWVRTAPAALYEPDVAIGLGAVWEGDELVTYDLAPLEHSLAHLHEQFMEDPD